MVGGFSLALDQRLTNATADVMRLYYNDCHFDLWDENEET
jgi:hypothetical protein